MKTFKVLREHEGDRFYKVGEERELDAAEAKHLVDLKVLAPVGGEEKAEPAPADKSEPKPGNKAEQAAPKNKAS